MACFSCSRAWFPAAAALLVAACGAAPEAPAAGRRSAEPSAEAPAESAAAPAAEAPAEPGPVAPTGSPAPARAVPIPEERERLVGWWLRHDQGYMIVIDAIGEDGRVDARYLNPRPIHVSKAETWLEGGGVRMLVELTDRNYPGNFYELAYRPDQDKWIGLYHHLGNEETYEVYFTRFEGE